MPQTRGILNPERTRLNSRAYYPQACSSVKIAELWAHCTQFQLKQHSLTQYVTMGLQWIKIMDRRTVKTSLFFIFLSPILCWVMKLKNFSFDASLNFMENSFLETVLHINVCSYNQTVLSDFFCYTFEFSNRERKFLYKKNRKVKL